MKIIQVNDIHLTSVTPSSRIDNYLESILKKLETIFIEAASIKARIFIPGDIFNTPAVIDEVKNSLMDLINKYNVIIYVEPGNHDLLYYNYSHLNRTSLGTMIKSGKVIEVPEFPKYLEIEKYKFSSISQEYLPGCPKADKNTVLLGHAFLGEHFKDKLHLNKDSVSKSEAIVLMLGHDHNAYPVKDLGGTLVSRPGALSRGSSNTENSIRDISYALIDLDNKIIEYKSVHSAKDFNDVFKKNYKVEKKQMTSFEDVKRFIEALSSQQLEANVFDILLSLELSEPVYNKATEYLNAVGLNT